MFSSFNFLIWSILKKKKSQVNTTNISDFICWPWFVLAMPCKGNLRYNTSFICKSNSKLKARNNFLRGHVCYTKTHKSDSSPNVHTYFHSMGSNFSHTSNMNLSKMAFSAWNWSKSHGICTRCTRTLWCIHTAHELHCPLRFLPSHLMSQQRTSC